MNREGRKKNISIRSSRRPISFNDLIEMFPVQALVDISGITINVGNSGFLMLSERHDYRMTKK